MGLVCPPLFLFIIVSVSQGGWERREATKGSAERQILQRQEEWALRPGKDGGDPHRARGMRPKCSSSKQPISRRERSSKENLILLLGGQQPADTALILLTQCKQVGN